MTDLEKQIEQERQEIEQAPAVPLKQLQPKGSGLVGRCSWCGKFSENLIYVETIHGVERYKCELCGRRHV